MRSIIANLTPASGRQDHTASPSASNVIRLLTKPASIASRLNVRDDRDTPPCVGGTGSDVEVIWVRSEPEYFCDEDWTGEIRLKAKGNLSPPCGTRFGAPRQLNALSA
jgi:hypothetical protein